MSQSIGLPPNVIGQCRGIFEIEVVDILWSLNNKTTNQKGVTSTDRKKHNNSSSNILKFIWWGENEQIAKQCEFQQIKKRNNKIILQYNICTNIKLFYDYLRNCEPIEVKITSKISNLQIGTVFVKINEKFLTDLYKSIVNCESKNQIFSPRNNILGDLVLKMRMEFYEPLLTECKKLQSPNSISSKNDQHEIINSQPLNINHCYETYKLEQKSARQSVRTNSNCSSRVMEYLTGRTMSYDDEQEALKEIHRTSPINNYILNDFSSYSEIVSKPKEILCKIQLPLIEKIDTIRLKLKYLKLLPPGIREVYVDSLINTTFTVECKISPNILHNCNGIIRFYSDSYNDKEQRIDFNKEVINCIKIISNEFNPQIIEHSEILFTIWWREFGSIQPRCLGTSKYRFTNLLNLFDFQQTKKLRIQSCAGGIHVADLICTFTLGINGAHFGPDLRAIIDNVQSEVELNLLNPFSASSSCKYNNNLLKKKILCEQNNNDKITTIPNSNNNTNESKKSSRPQENCNVTSVGTQSTATKSTGNEFNSNYNNEKDMNQLKSVKNKNSGNFRCLQGLLYVGSIKNLPPINNGGYFLVCRSFWKEDATSTEFAQCDNFNFLEMFPVINDEKFLERTRNNHLKLEIWQKTVDTTEHLIGVVRLPLHQFFIAFRDTELTNHLCRSKNPVISMDGWASIVGPLSGAICGQVQTILAVGTEEQLEELKLKRGISSDAVYKTSPNSPRIPVPELILKTVPQEQCNLAANNQINVNGTSKINENSDIIVDKREKLTDLLGNLQQKISLNESSSNVEQKSYNQKPIANKQQDQQTVCLTSNLLDVLQKALNVPSTSDYVIPGLIPPTNNSILDSNICKILLEIECALHLPRNPFKLVSKKSGTQKRNANKDKQNLLYSPNEEPCAYVTFQAIEGYGPMIKSHEGMVYATNIIEKCSNPSWGKRFEIAVPIDMLVNDEKHFILKVWRKAVTRSSQNRLVPTPMEDSIIGFAAIDLTVLMARMPCISGWFNIVDFNGRINGQLKVNVKPLEDVMKFKSSKNCSAKYSVNCCASNNPFVTDVPSKETQNNVSPLTSAALNLDLNSETSSSTSNDGISDLNNTTLSRAIKRKFTELEEITQRLRARLLDVTGEPQLNSGDCNFLNEIDDDAQLDEFERDLNTVCIEDNDDSLKDCQMKYFNSQTIDSSKNITDDSEEYKNDNLSSRTYITEDEIQSSSSSNERIQIISNFLQRTELNLNRNNDFKTSEDGIDDKEHSGSNI